MKKTFVLIALSSALACGEELAFRSELRPVIDGRIDKGDPSVVALIIDDMYLCSGSLITPRVVLTAAHCLPGAPRVYAFFGSDLLEGGEVRRMVDFELNDMVDLALVTLSTSAPSTPLPINDRFLKPYEGSTMRVVGFGRTSNEGDGGAKFDGVTKLDAVEVDDFVTRTGARTCFGDSGGPFFLRIEGVEYVAGVVSSGNSFLCSEAFDRAVRVDKRRAWIEAYLEAQGEPMPVYPPAMEPRMPSTSDDDDDPPRMLEESSCRCVRSRISIAAWSAIVLALAFVLVGWPVRSRNS